MKCTRPLTAYRSKKGHTKNGKWPIVFNKSDGYKDKKVTVPCGRCIACRLEKSRTWAVRCVNEAHMYDENCFVTLTYNEDNIPLDGSLDKKVVQDFIKELRRNLISYVRKDRIKGTRKWKETLVKNQYKIGHKIRYFMCGEYGENNTLRPHYHLCLFNCDFHDKYCYTIRKGVKLYRSETLERIWKGGYSTIGELTFESAAYVSRYIMKKRLGKSDNIDENGLTNEEYYYRINEETGEITEVLPEFTLQSLKPGIGEPYVQKYGNSIKVRDKVVVRNNLQIPPPIYYDNIQEKSDPEELKKRKEKRRLQSRDLMLDELYKLDKYNEEIQKHFKERHTYV